MKESIVKILVIIALLFVPSRCKRRKLRNKWLKKDKAITCKEDKKSHKSLFKKRVQILLLCLMPVAKVRRKLRRKWRAAAMGENTQGSAAEALNLPFSKELYIVENYKPLVSIIVPNYNHAKYLEERLNSIYKQTYDNYEVILLDDNSSDNSKEILSKYDAQFKEKTRVCYNEKNSGHVFSQWEKGILMAKGDLIWIAESDDYCNDNFLELLVPYFSLTAVSLAYARSIFVKNGEKTWSIEEYLHDIAGDKWCHRFVETSDSLVKNYFSIKNIIPNASSAIFRNHKRFDIFKHPSIKELKLCGDWFFYLSQISGGMIAYEPDAVNYYRIHDGSTSLKIQTLERYYVEHKIIAEYVHEMFNVPYESLKRMEEMLRGKFFSDANFNEKSSFDSLYHLNDLSRDNYRLNIIMCGAGFLSGGGETFPIYLANELKERGHNVTYFDFRYLKEEEGIRNLLRSDIPVVSLVSYDNLSSILSSFGADIVHTHFLNCDAKISTISAQQKKFNHIVTLHGMYESVPDDYLERIEANLDEIVSNVDQFVYIADKGINYFKTKGYETNAKFWKILNGLPSFVKSTMTREELKIPHDAFVVCLVSRGIKEKGWEEAIEIIQKVNDRILRKVYLLILGDGAMYDELIEQYSDNETIRLLGFKANPRDYFSISDLGLLPTYFKGESCPLVLIDCLMTGKPFVVTDIGEAKNQLTGHNGEMAGCVVPLLNGRPDITAFSEIVACLASDTKLYNKLCVDVQKVAKIHDIKNVAQRYQEVYFCR